jgi:hypothetical protein
MEVVGKIIVIGDVETFGAKGFKKRQLVVETDSKYPQSIPIDFTQDKVVILDNYKLGDFVTVDINIRGSKWNERYFVNLDGWKIQKTDSEKTASAFMPDREKVLEPEAEMPQIGEDEDDLPF